MQFGYDGGCMVYRYERGIRKFLFLTKGPKDRLDLPKGHIEKGESAEQAAIRETKEETGLDVKPDRFFRFTVAFWFMAEGEKIRNSVSAVSRRAVLNVFPILPCSRNIV